MSSKEFTEWMAYYNLEPFGNDLALSDAHHANLMALIANVNRDPKKSKVYKPEDFQLLKGEEQEIEKKPAEIYSALKTWALSLRKRNK